VRPKRPTPPSDELKERFGVNLRKHRKRLGISQHELAFRSEMALPSISLLELGKKQPRIDSLIRLAGALEVTPDELTAGIGWMPAEIVATPGSFDVPDDPELAVEVAELRGGVRGFRGKRSKR
jgi:transcriptional regulator with XRE-family HTH domain